MLLSLPRDSIRVILGHLDERKRIKFLTTNKALRPWLNERRVAAVNAFEGFTTRLGEVNGQLEGDGYVTVSKKQSTERGTMRSMQIVNLLPSNLIRISTTVTITRPTAVRHVLPTIIELFSPWAHVVLRTGTEDRVVDDSESDEVIHLLLSESKRLV